MRTPRLAPLSCLALAATAAAVHSQDPAEGTRELVYRFEIEQAIARGELDAKTDPDAVMEQMLALLRARLDGIAAEVEVSRRGTGDVVVAVPPGAAAALPEIRRVIETPAARLEMRMLATAKASRDGVSFDLPVERQRLERWLEQDDHRAQVAQNPHHIDAFNALRTADGGRLQSKLRWYPRKVFPDAKDPKRWSYSYSGDPRSSASAVPVFTAEQLAKGPPETTDERPFLVELFPIDMHEESFGGDDMNRDEVRVGTDPNSGLPCVFYEIIAGRKSAYADFSSRHLDEQCAVIVDGIVRSAPSFRGRIYGSGIIMGSFTEEEAAALVRGLKLGGFPIAPKLISQR